MEIMETELKLPIYTLVYTDGTVKRFVSGFDSKTYGWLEVLYEAAKIPEIKHSKLVPATLLRDGNPFMRGDLFIQLANEYVIARQEELDEATRRVEQKYKETEIGRL
jgi:hypothetical protein